MKNIVNKIITLILVAIFPSILGGHGGHAGHHGHHGGHHRHHEGHYGHHVGHHRGHHGWNRGGLGWGSGWGFGYPGWWTLGATAALLSGTWYYGGYTIDEWQKRAAQNPSVNNYYTRVVQPAYEQYQANPDLLQNQESAEKG